VVSASPAALNTIWSPLAPKSHVLLKECTQVWTEFFIFRSGLARVYCAQTAISSVAAETLHVPPETQWERNVLRTVEDTSRRIWGPHFCFTSSERRITRFRSLFTLRISKVFPQYCTISNHLHSFTFLTRFVQR
jgi:hypothetical protein